MFENWWEFGFFLVTVKLVLTNYSLSKNNHIYNKENWALSFKVPKYATMGLI